MIDLGPLVVSVIGIIILIAGCVALYPCVIFWRSYRQLSRHGIVVQGRVIEHHKESGWRGQPWYYLTCSYNFVGENYLCDEPVWQTFYEREELYVSLRCLPGKLEQAIILGDDFLRVEWAQRTIPGCLFIIIGLCILCSFLPSVLTMLR